jgi:hypothetical protein
MGAIACSFYNQRRLVEVHEQNATIQEIDSAANPQQREHNACEVIGCKLAELCLEAKTLCESSRSSVFILAS